MKEGDQLGDDWRATFEAVSLDQLLAFAQASHEEKFLALTAMYEVYEAAQRRLANPRPARP